MAVVRLFSRINGSSKRLLSISAFDTPEHRAMRASARKFIDKEINPFVDEWEEKRIFPAHALFKKMGSQGFLGVNRSVEDGGLGLDFSFSVALGEEWGAVRCGGVVMGIGVQADCATPALAKFGSKELRRQFLTPSIKGDMVACIGVSEVEAASDVANIRTTAVKDGDDYVINGGKMWITNGSQADWMCLLAVTGGDDLHRNKSLICLPLKTKGVTVTKVLSKMGMYSSDTAQFVFENVRVPRKYLIGEEGKGFYYQMLQFQEERILITAANLRLFEILISDTIKYTSVRKTFGKPIISNQAVQFRLAELQTEIELLRSLFQRIIGLYLEGKDVTYLTSMAKLKCGRLLREIPDACLQYYGGMGFMNETHVSRAYRDGRLLSIGGGADEIMMGIIWKYMAADHSKRKINGSSKRLLSISAFDTPEHRAMRESARKFIDKEINPFVDEWEEKRIFPAHALFKKMGSQGFLGVNRSVEDGGLGLDYSFATALAEEWGAVRCGGVPMAIGVQTDMATPALAKFGSKELRRQFLTPSIKGDMVACIGVSEVEAASDVANIRTTAVKDGDDYVINGGKMWITNGSQADWMCLLAVTGGDDLHRNKSLICLPLKTKGVTVTKVLSKMGMHSSDTAQFVFENVRVPRKYLIGEEGKGFYYQMLQFQEERLWACASNIRCFEILISDTIKYTSVRKTFGKPIISNQAVQFRLAELQTEIELLRSLVYSALGLYLEGKDVTYLTSMAKLKCGRLSREIPDACLQYYGGMGFMNETHVSRAYRDGRLLSIGGGADEIMMGIIWKYMAADHSKRK